MATSVVFHDANSTGEEGTPLFDCFSQNLNDKNVIKDSTATDSASENDKIITFIDKPINNMNKSDDLSTSTKFNAWVKNNAPFKLGTDFFKIKQRDTNFYLTKKDDDKLYFDNVGAPYIFFYESDSKILRYSSGARVNMRIDGAAGSEARYVLVEGGADTYYFDFALFPNSISGDEYTIKAGKFADGDRPIILVNNVTTTEKRGIVQGIIGHTSSSTQNELKFILEKF
jgi:hypothetical protein